MSTPTWPRIFGRTPEERMARRLTALENRVQTLERQNVIGVQTDWVGADGTPLVGGITSSTATLIGGIVCSVEVPSDVTSLVLISAYAELGCSTAASATLRVGLVEDTEGDFPLADKNTLFAMTGANMAAGEKMWTGTGHDAGANNLTLNEPGSTLAFAFSQGMFIDPYRKRGVAALPMPVNAGPRTYRLSRWRESGTGTCQIYAAYLSVIVLPGGDQNA